jgi:hypothetical protein
MVAPWWQWQERTALPSLVTQDLVSETKLWRLIFQKYGVSTRDVLLDFLVY